MRFPASIDQGLCLRGGLGFWLFSAFCYLGLFGTAQAAPEKWHMLETPRFTIISELREKDTREWAEQFDQFLDALTQLIRIDQKLLPPLTIVFFDREKAFRPYLPLRPDGQPGPYAAFFSRRDTWAVVGLSDGLDDTITQRTIFHEGVHWVMSAIRGYDTPAWLGEGLAEVFSTFRVDKGKGKAIWGEIIPYHIAQLNNEKLIPMGTLLRLDRTSKLFNENDRINIFYAQSWAFVHYLIFSEKKGPHVSFGEFVNTVSSGLSAEDCFKKCFGLDSNGMEAELRHMLHGGSYNIGGKKLTDGSKMTEPYIPAPAERVEVALGHLALVTGRRDLAEQHARAAIQAAPEKPVGYDFLAVVGQEKGDVDAALTASKQAIEHGSKDAWTYYLHGATIQTQALALGGVPPAESRTIADLYEKAIDLNPNLKLLYVELGRVLSEVAAAKDTDDQYLELGRKNFPGEGLIFVGTARLAYLRGKRQDAQNFMSSALARKQSLSPNEAETINHMRYEWLWAEYYDAIKKAADDGLFPEAMQLFDQAAKEDLPRDIRKVMENYKLVIYPLMRIDEANQMMSAGNHLGAKKIYEEVIAMPTITPLFRRQLQGFLEKLKTQMPDFAAAPRETPE